MIELVEKFLKAEILDGQNHWEPESGAPQGAVFSPLLSNLYLNELDHLMVSCGFEMTRYADDLVIQCKSLADAQSALAKVAAWTCERETHAAPDQDEDSRRRSGRFRIPWLQIHQALAISSQEKPDETQGHDPT